MKHLGLVCGLALVLSSCGTVDPHKGNPYPNGQFQSTVGVWDQEVVDQCHAIAMHVVGEAVEPLLKAGEKVDPTLVQRALDEVFSQCLAKYGRTI